YATAFDAPFISGKDSLYNESPMGPITPTLLITAIGIVPDIHSIVSMETKTPDDALYVVGETLNEMGGSEYYKLLGHIGKNVPRVNKLTAKQTFEAITKTIDLGLIKACHDLSEGGLGVAAAEMALAGGFGIELDLAKAPRNGFDRDDHILFAESNSRFLIEVSEESKAEFELSMKGKIFAEIGKVTSNPRFMVRGLDGTIKADISQTDLRKSWKATLSSGVEFK
ncbi:MAG: AIR synthase-related protein, partial [Chloroflexota bacterium]